MHVIVTILNPVDICMFVCIRTYFFPCLIREAVVQTAIFLKLLYKCFSHEKFGAACTKTRKMVFPHSDTAFHEKKILTK